MAIVFPFGTSSRNRSRRVDAMSTVRRLRSRKSARSSWRVISVNGRAIEDQLTHPLPRLVRFAMLRQAGHVAPRIVDGCEYPTIGRAEWATQWFGKVRSGEGHWLNTQN